MTWREFLLTTCAWIIALIAGVMSYAQMARSESKLYGISQVEVATKAQVSAAKLAGKLDSRP